MTKEESKYPTIRMCRNTNQTHYNLPIHWYHECTTLQITPQQRSQWCLLVGVGCDCRIKWCPSTTFTSLWLGAGQSSSSLASCNLSLSSISRRTSHLRSSEHSELSNTISLHCSTALDKSSIEESAKASYYKQHSIAGTTNLEFNNDT